MGRFGQDLREQRERRGISLETVCAVTKVSARHVEALESGEYGSLPGGVFRKGIVRSYLAAVGLEEAEWMDRFEASCPTDAGDRDWVEFAENVKRGRPERTRSTRLRWLGVSLITVVLLVLTWLTWRFLLGH